MNGIIELQPNQLRQYIDAETIFLEMLHVRKEQVQTRGSMFWREISASHLRRDELQYQWVTFDSLTWFSWQGQLTHLAD